MTDEQLQALIAALRVPAVPVAVAQVPAHAMPGTAAVVGTMPACSLGRNKLKRFKKWNDWIRDAENKMKFLGLTTDDQKMSFIRSCGGPDLTEFWEKEARLRFEEIPADPANNVVRQPAHTYQQVKEESTKALLKLISRDRAIMDLLRMEQGTRSFMEFLSEVEDQEKLCRIEAQRLTGDDMKRISLIAGMKDRTLAEKAIAEEYDLTKVIQAGINRESSRANVEAMQAKHTTPVSRVVYEQELSDGELEARIDHLQAELSNVMQIKKAGRYSTRYSGEKRKETGPRCSRCTYNHAPDASCPAQSRTCNTCGKTGHFSRSIECKGDKKSGTKRSYTMKRVEYEVSDTESENSDIDQQGQGAAIVRRIGTDSSRAWPGVQKDCQNYQDIKYLHKPDSTSSRYVQIILGGRDLSLYCDTGSKLTIIPPDLYEEEMGEVIPAKCHLRAWGSDTYLDTKGMFKTWIETRSGAKKHTWVYVVGGTKPEPLLGDKDAEDLGIITFNAAGKEVPQNITPQSVQKIAVQQTNKSIPQKLRDAGIHVRTEKPASTPISEQDKATTMAIVQKYTGSVFTDTIGKMKTRPITLQYDEGFKPIQPPRYPVPYHYRERLTNHLEKLKAEGVIEDVEPSEPIDCVLNVAISEKKTKGMIRMNIDARPLNVGAKHTKYHVTTPQEIRHQLEGAKVFSEIDMGNGFHQLPLVEESQAVFQTHQGLHRMKRLFFGPKNSSGIFHHEVQKAFTGVPGCTTIHDNVLVHGKNVEEHNHNLRATLQRAADRGVTFKLDKSTFCTPEVRWFGRMYSEFGISADPDKIKTIIEAGRPNSNEEVKSFLQAAAYNAKFAFDHKENQSYEDVTAPLRELLHSGAKFEWNKEREQSYQKLMNMMNDRSILAPFQLTRKTHLVTDASPHGISASLYQEDEDGTWLPVDHASRALSKHEQAWQSQIDWESLAKTWGMQLFRPYLVGTKFTSWGDHQPLLPLYNDLTKTAPVRIAKHRSKVIDLDFTDKYLPGRLMPSDYNSRHPTPISGLTEQQREELYIDDGDDVHIMRMILSDLPPALTEKKIQEVAQKDEKYQQLKSAVQAGKKPDDPNLTAYTSVWNELAVINGLICRGERLVIPQGDLSEDEGTLREWVVDLGHSGHMGMAATKRLLRQRLWFPGMDRLVERRVASCLPCQASTVTPTRDPLKPSKAPEEPWTKVYCDHWGPTADGKHMLVFIDALSRYPEVITVRGTSAEDNILAFAEVFARHGYPQYLHSDNGPPFNGKESHLLQQYLATVGVLHRPNYSAEDPEATGMVEAFMKHLKKVFHTASVAHQNPYMLLQDHLLQFRATPHPSTNRSPAELLFGRKFSTQLPDLRSNPAKDRADVQEARQNDEQAKKTMKLYKDRKATVKPHEIRIGDMVLLKRKSTKHRSTYDPEPYRVTQIWGTQIKAQRGREEKTRDAQRWKRVTIKAPKRYTATVAQRNASTYHEDPDIGAGGNTQAAETMTAEPVPRGPVQQADPLLQQTLRNNPNIIWAETAANRPTRTRRPPSVIYAPTPFRGQYKGGKR